MKIVLQPHLKLRLKERLIPEDFPARILKRPDGKYIDQITGHQIAFRTLSYNQKLRRNRSD